MALIDKNFTFQNKKELWPNIIRRINKLFKSFTLF